MLIKWLKIIISVICVAAFSRASAQTYEDVTVAAGFFGLNSSWASAWADMDNDGDLDVITIGRVQPLTGSITQILCNNGDETFSDITVESGYFHFNSDAHSVVYHAPVIFPWSLTSHHVEKISWFVCISGA